MAPALLPVLSFLEKDAFAQARECLCHTIKLMPGDLLRELSTYVPTNSFRMPKWLNESS